MHLTELSCTARLLLVTVFRLCALGDSLTVRYAWLEVVYLYLVDVLKTPFQRAEVEFTLSANDGLTQFLRLLYYPCWVFLTHTCQSCHHLLRIALILCLDSARILRIRICEEVEAILAILTIQRVASLDVLQFHSTTDVACYHLVNRDTVGTCRSEYLSDALLRATVGIGEIVTTLYFATHHLEVLHLADVWFHACLEEIYRLRTIGVDSNLLTASVVHLRHLIYVRYYVAQELHQTAYAHVLTCADAEEWEYAASHQTLADALTELILCQGLCLEELLHQSLVILCSSLYESLVQLHRLVHLLSRDVLDDWRTALGLP